MIRISLLYIIWSGIYLIWYTVNGIKEGWLSIVDLFWYVINTVLSTSYYHLWFLISLIYAIPIMYFVLRYIKVKYLITISIYLYFIGLLNGSYSFVINHNNITWNAWILICEKWPRIITVIFNVIPICSFALIIPNTFKQRRSYNQYVLLLIWAIHILLFICEYMCVKHFSNDTVSAYLVTTIPTTLFTFLCAQNILINLKHHVLLRKMSTVIYCVHPLIIGVVDLFISTKVINSVLLFFLVAIVSLSISLTIVIISNKYKFFRFLKVLY